MKEEQYKGIERRLDNALRLITSGKTELNTAAMLCISEIAEAVHELALSIWTNQREEPPR